MSLHLRVQRSTIPILLAAGVVLATIPFAIRDRIVAGDLYLFSERFFDDLGLRVTGLGRLRFIFQPLMAMLLGVRDGRADAVAGRPSFLVRIFLPQHPTREAIREAVRSISTLLAIAILVDVVCQLVLLGRAHPLPALLIGPVLVAIPYAVFRTAARWLEKK